MTRIEWNFRNYTLKHTSVDRLLYKQIQKEQEQYQYIVHIQKSRMRDKLVLETSVQQIQSTVNNLMIVARFICSNRLSSGELEWERES